MSTENDRGGYGGRGPARRSVSSARYTVSGGAGGLSGDGSGGEVRSRIVVEVKVDESAVLSCGLHTTPPISGSGTAGV